MENFYLDGYKDLKLFCTKYIPEKPKAVLMIIHGMREHSGRYKEFAEFMCKKGYLVITSDNRGHGNTMKDKNEFGHGKFGDIYGETIEDQKLIVKYAKEFNLPIYLFAHSYGSMLAQTLIQECPEIEKTILQGTNNGNNIVYKFGKIVGNLLRFFGKDNKPSSIFENPGKKSWGKTHGGNWLSRDEDVYIRYKQDEKCNGSFPVSFYRSLMSHMTKVNKSIKKIKPTQKIMLTCGSLDPVGNNGKNVKKLHQTYLKNGVNSKLIIYPNAWHELHNEINKKEVFADILNFYEN